MARVVTFEELQEGMIIAAPLVNRYGQVLLPAGVLIVSSHLQLLKTWGVRTVSVEGDDAGEEKLVEDSALRSSASDHVRKRLNWELRNRYEEALFAISIKRFMEKANEKQESTGDNQR